jgi:hypothetical protein
MNDKPIRLSATQGNMYQNCARQYAFRYIEGLRIPPAGVLKQSGVAHMAYERNYNQKATSLTDLPLDEMTDFFAETWEQEIQREEVRWEEGEGKDKLKDQGVLVVKAHHSTIAPVVVPKIENGQPLVEHKILVPLVAKSPGCARHLGMPIALCEDCSQLRVQFELDGRLDVVDIQNIIRDNKTVGKRPPKLDVHKDFQLSMYAIARRIETKIPETGLALDVVVRNKTPVAVTLPTERTREYLLLVLNQLGHIARGIQNHVFPLNTRSPLCNPKWCGYADRCVWGKMPKHIDMAPEQDLEPALKQSVERAQQENSQ